jgi:hypothetical protein
MGFLTRKSLDSSNADWREKANSLQEANEMCLVQLEEWTKRYPVIDSQDRTTWEDYQSLFDDTFRIKGGLCEDTIELASQLGKIEISLTDLFNNYGKPKMSKVAGNPYHAASFCLEYQLTLLMISHYSWITSISYEYYKKFNLITAAIAEDARKTQNTSRALLRSLQIDKDIFSEMVRADYQNSPPNIIHYSRFAAGMTKELQPTLRKHFNEARGLYPWITGKDRMPDFSNIWPDRTHATLFPEIADQG